MLLEYGSKIRNYDSLLNREKFDKGLKVTDVAEEIEPDDDGNIVIDMSVLSEDQISMVNREFMQHVCLYFREKDEYSDDALLVYKNDSEHIETKSTSDLSIDDAGKICRIEGTVMEVSDKRMNEMYSYYECQNRHESHRLNERWRTEHVPPRSCSDEDCTAPVIKKSHDVALSKQIDVQQVVVGEIGKDDRNSTRIVGEVDRHLIGEIERRDNVKLWAIPKVADGDSQKKKYYLHILGVDSTDEDIKLDDEKIEELEEIEEKQDDIIQHLADSVAPTIVPRIGHDTARKAILTSIVRGSNQSEEDKTTINTLLYGKPGTGKTDIIQSGVDITPTSKYVDGAQATSAGILGTTVQEETIDNDNGSWITIAGAIPQCHNGLVAIDELDKAGQKTQKSLNTPMQSGKVVINKAGAGDLPADTSIVAAANPEDETYSGMAPIESLNINHSLKDRFDLIVRVDDDVAETAEEEREFLEEKQKRKLEGVDGVLDEKELKEYLAYARTKEPEFSEVATKAITDKLLKLRVASREVQLDGIQMSGRAQGKLTRISSAIAKLRLSDVVTADDVERAWQLIRDSWQSLTFDAFKFEDDFDLMRAAQVASNPSQQQVMRQTLGALNIAQDDENQLNKELVYEAVDADTQVAEWSLSTLQDKGHIRMDDETITVIELPE